MPAAGGKTEEKRARRRWLRCGTNEECDIVRLFVTTRIDAEKGG